ncbi:MAG TPA: FG-GAP-like repeat-containing protein [Kiritimatiellia bacterium]|nr:FG-GAP-like repeat-containing protein [Kiritimatiellia bacterium]
MADIDGDGVLDAVAAASIAGAVAWWKNVDGSGTNWVMNVIDAAFPSANSVAVYDLDRDGKPDVIGSAGGTTDQVVWWRNVDGSGTNWTKHVVDGFFDGARSVQVADINNDGYPDIIAAAQTANAVSWYQNVDGSGTNWIKRNISTSFSGATAVRAADINRDGYMDVVGSAGTANTIAWWKNIDGTGTNWAYHAVDTTFSNAQSIAVADIDNDGVPDLIGAANFNPGRIMWWRNMDGEGGAWTSRVISANFNGAFAVYAADLDQDGDADVLAVALTADDVTWFENTGKGTNWITHTVDGNFDGARAISAIDVDGDGQLDIVAAAFIENRVAWWRNQSIHYTASYCTANLVSDSFIGAQSIIAIDMDRDGDMDLVGASSTGNRISWWENADGAGGTWLERQVDTNVTAATSIQSADIDGNGRPDIVSASRSTHTISWWKDMDGSGQNWQRYFITTNFLLVQATATGDLNGDGREDVAAVSFGSGEIRCWLNIDGGENWAQVLVATNFNGANQVTLEDVNRDGKLDIVASAFSLGHIAWWENVDGSGTNWVKHSIDVSFSGVLSVATADMDRDGKMDIVASSVFLNQIAWWENVGGTGTNWVKHVVDSAVEGAANILVADLDADGDPDIYGMSASGNRFSWWENLGNSASWRRHALSPGDLNATDIAIADLNGNGKLDLVGAIFIDEPVQTPTILWWPNRGGQFMLAGSNTLPAVVTPGGTASVQSLTFKHGGRIGDRDIELGSLAVRFEKFDQTPMTPGEASNLIQSLTLYRDTGSGQFEVDADDFVTSISSLSISSGVQVINLTNATPLAQCAAGQSNTYFLVANFSQQAGKQLFNKFRITLLTDQSSARDSNAGIPLSRQCNTGIVTSIATLITQADLSISGIATPETIDSDSNLVFSITIANIGPDNAFDVVITNTLPIPSTFSASASSPECVVSGGVVICHAGIVTSGQVKVFGIATYVGGTAIGAITNTAIVRSSSVDSNLANNITVTIVSVPDTDGDGVADFIDPDDDGDGMPDWWEILHGLDPKDPADAGIDSDYDGFTNLQEYIADTNPQDDLSYFVIESFEETGVTMVFFMSSSERIYTMQYSDNPADGSWSNVAGQVNVPGTGGLLALIDDSPGDGRIYRLLVSLP